MRPGVEVWITRVAVRTGAGRGIEPLLDAANTGADLAGEVPWAWPELRARRAVLLPASVLDLPPGAPGRADALLGEVVAEVATEGAGLVVGTSSGAISGDFEAARRDCPAGPLASGWRQAPTDRVAAGRGLGPVDTVSAACVSGAAALIRAAAWLVAGRAERVIVAGYDVLSPFIHAGFAGLGALAPDGCRPFTADRAGLTLGEGAAAFLVETAPSARAAGRAPLAALRGFGIAQDGVHLTAPDRTGGGLTRAIRAALAMAGATPGEIGAVSAHGTGTPFNDAMEARALATVFGDLPVPLHALKGVTGHTLGGAGAIEAAVCLALLGGASCPLPPPVDPALGLRVAPTRAPRLALSVNAAFGGVNTALVLGPPGHALPSPPPSPAPRLLARWTRADLPLRTLLAGSPAPPTLGRADRYVRAGIAALADHVLPPDAVVLLTSPSACHAADLRYQDELATVGPARASRAAFVYTIPGAPVAEAAILLGLRGATLASCAPAPDLDPTLPALLGGPGYHLHLDAPDGEAVASLHGPDPTSPA